MTTQIPDLRPLQQRVSAAKAEVLAAQERLRIALEDYGAAVKQRQQFDSAWSPRVVDS